MDNKKVIIASPHVWDSPYRVGSHQYAKCFSNNGWKAAYVSAPISPFHIFYYFISSQRAKVYLPQRLRSWVKGGKQINDIWTYVPFGLIPIANTFIFNTNWAIHQAGKFLIPPLITNLRKKGFGKVHAIWLDSPLFGYLLKKIPHDISILRIADDLTGFPELGKNILEAEKALARKVDIVLATARSLEKKIRDIGAKKIIYLPNGVDFQHFFNDISPEPTDLKDIPKPRVIYIGAIERWFNDDWLAYAALQRKDISFIIIGDYKEKTFANLERLPNVFFLGKRDYEKVPSYLKHSDIGIIPFKKLPFIDSINPIKLYEYMACGLPVVSTKWRALQEIGSPALLAESKEEFLQNITQGLEFNERGRHDHINFAEENSWAKRFELIEKYL